MKIELALRVAEKALIDDKELYFYKALNGQWMTNSNPHPVGRIMDGKVYSRNEFLSRFRESSIN